MPKYFPLGETRKVWADAAEQRVTATIRVEMERMIALRKKYYFNNFLSFVKYRIYLLSESHIGPLLESGDGN